MTGGAVTGTNVMLGAKKHSGVAFFTIPRPTVALAAM